MSFLDAIRWNGDGLVPAVAQDASSGRVLTLAWMSRESLERTVATGEAHYWSRSRRKLWHKGETSGHVQRVVENALVYDLISPNRPAGAPRNRISYYLGQRQSG